LKQFNALECAETISNFVNNDKKKSLEERTTVFMFRVFADKMRELAERQVTEVNEATQ
jgi:hypothetical protein